MSEKVVFSGSLTTRIRTGGPHFEPDEAQFKEEIAKKYRQAGGALGGCRIHPTIRKFCADYWHEQARRLQFESKQSYDACSREVALREPFVYLSKGAVGDFERYDIDIAGSQGDDE